MAYGDDNSRLQNIAFGPPLGDSPGNVQMIYSYRTNDTTGDVETDGYFDGVLNDGLKLGDVIFVVSDEDGTPAFNAYVVTSGGADVAITPHDVS